MDKYSLRAKGEYIFLCHLMKATKIFASVCNMKLGILSSSCSQYFLQRVSHTGVPGAGDRESRFGQALLQ